MVLFGKRHHVFDIYEKANSAALSSFILSHSTSIMRSMPGYLAIISTQAVHHATGGSSSGYHQLLALITFSQSLLLLLSKMFHGMSYYFMS